MIYDNNSKAQDLEQENNYLLYLKKKEKYMKRKKLKSIITYISIACIVIFISSMAGRGIYYTKFENDNAKILDTIKIIKNFYYNADTSESELDELIIKGMIEGLPDEYSEYLSVESTNNRNEFYDGNVTNTGISISGNMINMVIDDSPASKAGIKVGDMILSINEISCISSSGELNEDNLKEALDSLTDDSNNTFIISRDDKELKFTFKIEPYKVDMVESKMIGEDIGYIKLTNFTKGMHNDFDNAINMIKSNKAKGLVLDLRGNGGGLVDSLEYVSNKLMSDVVIANIKYKNTSKNEVLKTGSEGLDIPIVVLTDGHTASCSEILAGAILANNKGISIGTTTYKKGTILGTLTLDDGSSISLATGEVILSNNENIEGKGIKPTIEELDSSIHIDLAVDYLNKQI